MGVGQERLERRDQQGEVEVQRLARLDGASPACRPQHDAIARLFPDGASPASFVVPGRGQAERQVTIVDVDQRAAVVIAGQLASQPGIHVAQPDAVLMVLLVPSPLELGGAEAAGSSHAHHVASRLAT